MRIELGLDVDCVDGPCGTVGDVVISPSRRVVTHLVIEPHDNREHARLVPIDAFDARASGPAVILRRRTEEVSRYPVVDERAFVTLADWPPLYNGEWEVGVFRVLALPFYDTVGLPGVSGAVPGADGVYMSYDRIPAGEVELRRRSAVEAADGKTLGHLDGLIVDDDARITHLVLERRHLWRRFHLSIPVTAVTQLRTDGVRLGLTAEEVAGLPTASVR